MVILLSGCQSIETPEPISDNIFALDTLITITLYDGSDQNLIDQCFTEITRLEKLLSKNIVGSDIDNINQAAGINEISVSAETIEVLKKGIAYSVLSNGAFDLSIGPLVDLWSIGNKDAKVPDATDITNALSTINYKNIIINEDKSTVFLAQKNMILDLGGIAKGYIADKLYTLLEENECSSAIINLGGNVLTLGTKPSGDLFRIGIQNPNLEIGNYLAIVEVSNQSIVTSGIYERYFIENDIKYHHILSPFTGFPYDSDIAGVTIISPKSIDGDALSTTCFALGTEKAITLIESLENTEAIFINSEGTIIKTTGIGSSINFTEVN